MVTKSKKWFIFVFVISICFIRNAVRSTRQTYANLIFYTYFIICYDVSHLNDEPPYFGVLDMVHIAWFPFASNTINSGSSSV